MRIDTFRPGNRQLSLLPDDCARLDDVIGKLEGQVPLDPEEQAFLTRLKTHLFVTYTDEPRSSLAPEHLALLKGGRP